MQKTVIEFSYNGIIALTKKVELPYYSRTDCHAYAILNENKMISVSYGLENAEKIEIHGKGYFEQAVKDNCIKIDAEEFDVIFLSVMNKMLELKK